MTGAHVVNSTEQVRAAFSLLFLSKFYQGSPTWDLGPMQCSIALPHSKSWLSYLCICANSIASSLFQLFIFFILVPFISSISFRIPSFDRNATTMFYEGDAQVLEEAIQMNDYDYLSRVGRATYFQHVPIWDKATQRLTDFTTHFSFSIETLRPDHYGHGLVFYLVPVNFQIPLNSDGGFLGLFNTTTLATPTRNKIVTVEFDSSVDGQYWDPPVQHVGICVNTLRSAIYVPWNASLHSGVVANAWVDYNSRNKRLSVFLTYADNPTFDGKYNFSYEVDLREVLPEWVSIGFSAATGRYVEANKVHSWEFNSSLEMKERNVTADGEKQKEEVNKWMVGFAASWGAVFICGLIIASVMFWRRKITSKKRKKTVGLTSINTDLERGTWPKKFSYEELVASTNNFSEERKLGEGGFGSVYKGYLTDFDMFVAVKKISSRSKQGKKEYLTEVNVISSLRHRNLVRLIGWCHQRGQFLLVYEFMPNGSLNTHLFGNKIFLSWEVRYKIALGLASALLYLHEEWEQCVVHRDIKSSNVMLDSGFNAKLGDFGLAKLMDHELGPRTTGLAGTWGYLAPEYISKGKASKESDVYSFGVVALEIACGRRPVENTEDETTMRLVEWVWELHGNGLVLEAVDKSLDTAFDVKQMERLMIVGLWCAHPDHSLRPSIKQAIQVLSFEAALPELPQTMPVPVYRVPTTSESHSSHGSITETSLSVGR
ncbi:L-type lectin-domain containing receptor kinase IX.1-like [Aristolochia californica]|uniref:L-type lectin-domain containing receptor kinase IX.1-like n=1 Tax=Aristolochia californica TaxID=171875 RepID=UPI0035DB6632